jgi:plasmid stability protein
MGAVTIRKIDDAIKQALREEAAAKGLSVEAELRDLLTRTYGPDARRPADRKPGESRITYLLRIAPDMTGFDLPARQPLEDPRFP